MNTSIHIYPNEDECCRHIAARVWCDQDMQHCEMDDEAAEEIAQIVKRVRMRAFKIKVCDDPV